MNLYSLFLKNYSEDKKLIFNNDEVNYKEFKDLVDVIANNINKNYNKIAILSGNQKLYLYFYLLALKKQKH